MTTALRSIDCTAPVPTVPDAAQLQRDLTSARTRAATLRRELVRMVAAPTVVSANVVDGMITLVLSTGAVLQRRPHVVDTAEECSFGFRWVEIEPAPGTKAAVAADAFADDENRPADLYGLAPSIGARTEQHDPTFRLLAQMAVRGGEMAVVDGGEL